MNINVINNVPEIDITVNKSEDNGFTILVASTKRKRLKDVPCGEAVQIGDRKYIVLEQSGDTTALIAEKITKKMVFGNDGDYRSSKVRNYLNTEFFNELSSVVGEKNIVKHTVRLITDDGTGADRTCKDHVSLLTADLYRRYRKYLPANGEWWWLATRVSAEVSDCAHLVCCVRFDGVLVWDGSDDSLGVRPFCILNSSILVS